VPQSDLCDVTYLLTFGQSFCESLFLLAGQLIADWEFWEHDSPLRPTLAPVLEELFIVAVVFFSAHAGVPR